MMKKIIKKVIKTRKNSEIPIINKKTESTAPVVEEGPDISHLI
jgi:hypothetical protein